MSQFYYQNNPVELLGKLSNGRVVISLLTEELGWYGEVDNEPDWSEPVHKEIVVNESDLTEKPLIFSEEFERKKTQIDKDLQNYRKTQREDLDAKIAAKQEELKTLKNLSENYEGLTDALKFLDPEYKYAIMYGSYNRLKLFEMEKGRIPSEESSWGKWRAVSLVNDYGRRSFKACISDGSDSSNYTSAGFYKTLDEALVKVVEVIEQSLTAQKNLDYSERNLITEYNLGAKSQLIYNYLQTQQEKAEEEKQAKIAKIQKELERLENE